MDHFTRQRPVARAIVVGLAALALLPGGARAASNGGVSIRPESFDPAIPATRAYFIDRGAGGQVFHDSTVVSNSAATPVKLYVDPVEALTGVTSGTVYANRQDPRSGAAQWITTPADVITVAPDRSAVVRFTLRIPPTAAAGDHVAGLAFENAAPARSGGRFSVTIVTRQVIGILIHVDGHALPRLTLGGVTFRDLPGTTQPAAIVSLANLGLRLCKPKLTAKLNGAAPVTRQLDTVLPGSRIAYPFPWPGPVPAGRHVLTVTATQCGAPVTVSASTMVAHALYTGRSGTRRLAAAADAGGQSGAPWWLVIVVGAVCTGAALCFRRRDRPGSATLPGRLS